MDSVLSSLPSSSSPPLPLPPSPPPEIKYDVFLSFRGEDTRDNFTSHLHTALRDKGIDTFIDYKLRSGDEISPALLQAIEESQIAIIIFSEHYASSRWCLEELAKILECKKNHGQIVIPVFHEIDPSHVRNQTGTFAVAFASHQRRFKKNLDKVQKWRCALNDAANLSGFDSRVVKPESVLVEKIVEDILERLNNMPSSDNEKLVGLESGITEIELALGIGDQTNKHVCLVGIWGIGGIGKTTLARAIYERIFYQFEGHCFVDSVTEALEKGYLSFLQQKLYSTILKDENACTYPFIKKRLSHKKLLIVFDDVSNFKQVKSLIDLDCLSSGSRVIVISRDRQVLKNLEVGYKFKVEDLCFSDALKLFCRYAFKQNRPKVGYNELSRRVVTMVGGVPLALEVLGSSLFGQENKNVWESSMKKLEKNLDKKIHDVLKISYEGLDHYQQKIFLDIACFYKGWVVDEVIAIMDASGFCAANDISALIDKSLIFISFNQLMMHNLLQEMGKEIVRQESFDDPGERSRLWDHKEINDVLTNATGTKNVEGIDLDMSKSRDIYLHRRALAKMTKMRYLRFSSSWYSKNKVHVLPRLQYVSAKLRYLEWYRCPLKSLESNFYLNKLVILKISESKIKELWRGDQQFDHLKHIDVRGCKNLISIPDLSRAPNLVSLNLSYCSKLQRLSEIPSNLERIEFLGCESLIELPSSFKHLNKVKRLDFIDCESLTSIPDLRGWESLRGIYFTRCLKLKMLPKLSTAANLVYLALYDCENLTSIPDCSGYKSLINIHLHCCPKLRRLSEIPSNLERLTFDGCKSLIELPSSFKHLNKVEDLEFTNCESLTSIPDLRGWESLKKLKLDGCLKLKMLPELPNSIEDLYLRDSLIEELPMSSQDLYRLRFLIVQDCTRLKSLPSSVCKWKSLVALKLYSCPKIGELPNDLGTLENLYNITVMETAVREVPSCLKSLRLLSISTNAMTEIPDSLCCLTSLKTLSLSGNNLKNIDSLCCLTSLETLCLDSKNLKNIPESIINLSNLRELDISDCERLEVLPKLPWANIYALNCTSLEELSCPSFCNDFFAQNSVYSSIGVHLGNCYKLDRNSLDNFLKNILQNIAGLAASAKTIYFSHFSKDLEEVEPCISICYPKSEIPEWFRYQKGGSFINVSLPKDSFNYNLLCFAVCVVMTFKDHQYDVETDVDDDDDDKNCFEVYYECTNKSVKGDGTLVWRLSSVVPEPHCQNDRSNHVVFGIGFHYFPKPCDNEFTFQFYSEPHHRTNIEKCGVHLVFGKHHEISDESEDVDEPNPEESDQENEPHPKRLKHF